MEIDTSRHYKSVIRKNLKKNLRNMSQETTWLMSHLIEAGSSWGNNVSFTHKCMKHFISDNTLTAFGYVFLHLAWQNTLWLTPLLPNLYMMSMGNTHVQHWQHLDNQRRVLLNLKWTETSGELVGKIVKQALTYKRLQLRLFLVCSVEKERERDLSRYKIEPLSSSKITKTKHFIDKFCC